MYFFICDWGLRERLRDEVKLGGTQRNSGRIESVPSYLDLTSGAMTGHDIPNEAVT